MQTAMFKDNKFRLFFSLVGIERLGDDDSPESTWILPSQVTASELAASLSRIQAGERGDALAEYGSRAADLIRRKSKAAGASSHNNNNNQTLDGLQSDSEGDDSFDEQLFPAGGPTARKSDVKRDPNKKKRRGNKHASEIDDEQKAMRATARRKADLEKRRKIKSDLYVHDSDDEPDEERDKVFFAKEEAVRKKAGASIEQAIERASKAESRKRKGDDAQSMGEEIELDSRKRRKSQGSEEEDGDTNADMDDVIDISSDQSSDDESDIEEAGTSEEDSETPVSSQAPEAVAPKIAMSSRLIDSGAMELDEVDTEPAKPIVRRNVRAGFVIDDSDSE
jgi:replication fork protection complex subunit Tof1/Swi1